MSIKEQFKYPTLPTGLSHDPKVNPDSLTCNGLPVIGWFSQVAGVTWFDRVLPTGLPDGALVRPLTYADAVVPEATKESPQGGTPDALSASALLRELRVTCNRNISMGNNNVPASFVLQELARLTTT